MRKALFLHTQKTAGTSIQEMARFCYGNKNVSSHADYTSHGLEGAHAFDFLSGHFGFEFARPLMADRYSFTFLREPCDRLISLYAFCASRDPEGSALYTAARNSSLEDFLRLAFSSDDDLRQTLWNHQTWQLAFGRGAHRAGVAQAKISDFEPAELLAMAKRNLAEFDYVGMVETFDADTVQIFQNLGVATPVVRRSNVSVNKPAMRDLPKSTIKLLHSITRLDRQLYWHAWRQRGLWIAIKQFVATKRPLTPPSSAN